MCACNTFGCSNFSASASGRTLNATQPSAPGQPEPFSASATSLSLTWLVSEAHGSNISGYELHKCEQTSTACVFVGGCVTAATECTLTALQPATLYTLRERALSANGTLDSPWGDNVTLHTQFAAAHPAVAPARLEALAVDADSALVQYPKPAGSDNLVIIFSSLALLNCTISWSPFPDDGGAEIVGYLVVFDTLPVDLPFPSNPSVSRSFAVTQPNFLQSAKLANLKPQVPFCECTR